MTDVDTSSYGKAPAPINPLQMYGQVVGIQNAQGQNRLLQQQQDLRAGMGQAFAGAVDPTTGKIDNNRLLATVAHDPRTAWNFGDVNQQTQANATATAQAQMAQLESAQKHLVAANGILSGYINDPDLGVKDISKKIAAGAVELLNHGDTMNSTSDAVKMISGIPTDPAAQKAYVIQHLNQNLALQGRVQDILGAPAAINTGDQTNIVRTPVAGGPPVVVGALNNTLSPGEKASPTPTFTSPGLGPDGNPLPPQAGTVPLGSIRDRYGNAAGGAAGAPAGMVSAPQGGAGAAAGAAPAGAAVPSQRVPAFLPNQPPLGQEAAANTAATGSAGGLNALHQAVATSGGRVFALEKALSGLQNTTTGPGTEQRNQIVSFLAAAPGVKNFVSQEALDGVKSFDEANKYLTQYASGQAGSMGPGTDAKLASALSGNASVHISNLAAQDVVKATIGMERMQQAQAQAFDESGLPPQDYNKWSVGWNKNVDPRAFVMDKLDAPQRAKLMDSMSAADKARFAATLRGAIKSGFVAVPGT